MQIGNILRGLRVQRRMGIQTLANRTGLTPGYISLVETNGRSYKTFDTLEAYAKALGIPFTVFIFLVEVEKLEQTNPELVRAMFNLYPELRYQVLFIRLQESKLIAPLPTTLREPHEELSRYD